MSAHTCALSQKRQTNNFSNNNQPKQQHCCSNKAEETTTKQIFFWINYTFLKSHTKNKKRNIASSVVPQRNCRQSYSRCHRRRSRPNFRFIFPLSSSFSSYFPFLIGHISNTISFLYSFGMGVCVCVCACVRALEFACVCFSVARNLSSVFVVFLLCFVVVSLDCGFPGIFNLLFIILCFCCCCLILLGTIILVDFSICTKENECFVDHKSHMVAHRKKKHTAVTVGPREK